MAFMLAREGFDVWMGNNRGNWFSLAHTEYTPREKEFWDFDFEEMGLYDVPASIDYILNETKQDKIASYIGHSEGTTQFFIGSSLKSEYYSQKVELFIGLAPIVRLEHSTNSAMVYASQIWPFLSEVV